MLDKGTLQDLYITRKMTAREIAETTNVKSPQTIYNWLENYGIPRRQHRAAQRSVVPSKETLQRLYIEQRLSIDAVARQLGSSESSISRFLNDYGICKRKRWEKTAGWNKGIPLPKWQRRHLSELAKKRTGVNSSRYGAILSEETRSKISNSLKGRFRGIANPNWKGGSKYERTMWQSRYEYKEWRSAVFQRDSYACQMCNKQSNGDIEAHHIYPWSKFSNRRFDVDNGITLCQDCHFLVNGKESKYTKMLVGIIRQSTP